MTKKKSAAPSFLLFIGLIAGVIILTFLWLYRFFTYEASVEIQSDISADPSYSFFSQSIVPILNDRCSNCHGIETQQFQSLQSKSVFSFFLRWETDASGHIKTPQQIKKAFETCTQTRKLENTVVSPILYQEIPMASPIVREALSRAFSGNATAHPEIFASPEDPDFKKLLAWVEKEIHSKETPSFEASSTDEFFAQKVAPILKRKTCFGSNCHGPFAFNDLKFVPEIPILPNSFTPRMHHQNRKAALGNVTRLVPLDGEVENSRLLLKCIPLEQGGITHKGGNHFLQKKDPDYQVLREWLLREKEDFEKQVQRSDFNQPNGILFVRRPKNTPERYFEDDSFLPGGDLFWLKQGKEINLTAILHPENEVDIRSPEVSYDAKTVVFSMRFSEETPFNLWEIDLITQHARQLTFSTHPSIHFLDPIYVPHPEDKEGVTLSHTQFVFVSNRANEWCLSSPEAYLGEAESGDALTIIDENCTLAPNHFTGKKIHFVAGKNAGETRTILEHQLKKLIWTDPLPEPCDSTTHYFIELNGRSAPKYDAYRMERAPLGKEKETFQETLRRMTYSPSQIRKPSLRSSGEIFFTALRFGWQKKRPYFNGAIFRTHLDGSNFHVHNGNRSQIPILAENKELSTGLEIRIGCSADSWWGGTLVISDHQFGPTIEPNNALDFLDHPYRQGKPNSSEFRFVPGWIFLEEKPELQGQTSGAYRTPYPLTDGSFLVAYTSDSFDLSDPNAAPNFDIAQIVPDPSFHAEDGFQSGKFIRQLLVVSEETELWPRPVVPRRKEPVKKVLKSEEKLFGPAPMISGISVFPEETEAILQVYDLFLLDSFFEQATPVGVRHLADLNCPSCGTATQRLEQIHFVRILGIEPSKTSQDASATHFLITEVPVEKDGSFFVQIPSKIGFDIQSLNAQKMALRSSNRWLYCLPGEKHSLSIPQKLYAQTCSGCHGSLTGDPKDTLRRPDTITSASWTLATWDSSQYDKLLPKNISSSSSFKPQYIHFKKDIWPILEQKCVQCHSQGGGFPALNLSLEHAFQQLLPYIDTKEYLAIQSKLIEKLLGEKLKTPEEFLGNGPHPQENPLTNEELLVFIRWIDLGAMDSKEQK